MKGWIFYVPFLTQAAVIFFDEFYFHIRRGLPRWERIGHPLDTLSLIICIVAVLVFPFSRITLILFLILAVISCLFVTKDEFVHKEHCPASEQWLHALLFLNHPVVLFSMGWMWFQGERYRPFLIMQLAVISLFCVYQIIYWNVVWKEK
ncbi:MAG: hypothetical protein WAM28_06730 [Chlamydiales bacterium]